jgi:hypothetical protein
LQGATPQKADANGKNFHKNITNQLFEVLLAANNTPPGNGMA